MNGIQVVHETFGQTMWDSQGAYWKQGFYRDAFHAVNTCTRTAPRPQRGGRPASRPYRLSACPLFAVCA